MSPAVSPLIDKILSAGMNAGNGFAIATAAIGIGYRRTLDRPARWLLAWIIVDAIVMIAALYGRFELYNSQYAAQVWYPISAGLALSLVASTLSTSQQRRSMYLAAAAVTSIIVALMLFVEEFGKFPRFTGAIHGLTLLAAGAILVMARATKARGDMLNDQGFVIGAAFMLAGAPSSLAAISVRYLGPDKVDMHTAIYALKFVLFAVAYCLMVKVFHASAQRGPASRSRRAP
jgi:hypothetical protein